MPLYAIIIVATFNSTAAYSLTEEHLVNHLTFYCSFPNGHISLSIVCKPSIRVNIFKCIA